MDRIAFVFSGQGDQTPGMGKEFAARSRAAAEVFERCDAIRPGTSKLCFEGPMDALSQTVNTQPCLFAFELAAVAALEARGVRPDMAAGFSLGEVAAATACGAFDFETGFALVCLRGELMQREAEKTAAGMAAVLKLEAGAVKALCSAHPGVYPVNFNCPGQVSVAGPSEALPAFIADVRKAGGRAVPLKVGGAFHSPYMDLAARDFREALNKAGMKALRIPLYSDKTARPYGDDREALLASQIASPVMWEALIRNMIAAGANTFIEIGPGRTLTNMMGKIDPAVRAIACTDILNEVVSC